MPLGLGEQKSRRFLIALVVGLLLPGSSVARAGDGSAPPKPQVLWHAYPLSPHQAGTSTARAVNAGAATTPSQSAPAERSNPAPVAASSLPTVPLAAAAAAVVAIIAVVVLLRRRRGAADATVDRASSEPSESVDAPAAEGLTGPSESVEPVPQARLAQSEKLERPVVAEHAGTRPTAEEKEVLKRTNETADAEAAAKLKSRAQASASLKHAREPDPTVLKAKLGEPRAKPSRTAPRSKQVHSANGAPAPLDRAAAASTPGTHEDKTNAHARTQAAMPVHCRIEWRADGNAYRFCAIAEMPSGEESVLQSSPPLDWNEDAPPGQHLPEAGSRITDRETKAINTYHALVSRLLAEGWMATGVRERWYELEMERPPEDAHEAQRQEGST